MLHGSGKDYSTVIDQDDHSIVKVSSKTEEVQAGQLCMHLTV